MRDILMRFTSRKFLLTLLGIFGAIIHFIPAPYAAYITMAYIAAEGIADAFGGGQVAAGVKTAATSAIGDLLKAWAAIKSAQGGTSGTTPTKT